MEARKRNIIFIIIAFFVGLSVCAISNLKDIQRNGQQQYKVTDSKTQ
ncbi:hypothetical protein KAR91_26950 [Candidatus Pacearchaeota archaeon]|nr:hypothetical protein [Candidatus Pacearchaeota archaeon]